jgi:hypothetical protein
VLIPGSRVVLVVISKVVDVVAGGLVVDDVVVLGDSVDVVVVGSSVVLDVVVEQVYASITYPL